MIISQHADVRNILTKIQTDAEESVKYTAQWDSEVSYAANDIVNYNGVLYKSRTGTSNVNKTPDTEAAYWEELKTGGGAGVFDAAELEGYGILATPIVTSGLTLASALCIADNGAGEGARLDAWSDTNSAVWQATTKGIQSHPHETGIANSDPMTHIGWWFSSGDGNWPASLANYATEPNGFYHICCPGPSGTSVKFWFDRVKIHAAMQSKVGAYLYIDKAGCLWHGDPVARSEGPGHFVCGPTMEDAFGKNVFNLYSNDNYNITDALIPMRGLSFRVVVGSSVNVWISTAAPGLGQTITGQATGAAVNQTPMYFVGSSGNNWTDFADVPTGMYYMNLPYHDGTNQIEGSKIPFWYDKDKYMEAFSGFDSQTIIPYVDQLGNIWRGNPESGGTFVCGPYEGMAYIDYKSKILDDIEPRVDDIEPRVTGYSATKTYAAGDTIVYGGWVWKSKQSSNTGNTPAAASAWWERTPRSIISWDSASTYTSGEAVVYTNKIYVATTTTTPGANPLATPGEWDEIAPGPTGSDEKIKVSADDTTAGYLNGKLVAGTGISLTEQSGGGNETLRVAVSGEFGGGGAVGVLDTILSGETEVSMGVSGEYNRAVVSAVGLNGGQRTPFIKSIAYSSPTTTVVAAIDSSYTEDIDVHVVLANE